MKKIITVYAALLLNGSLQAMTWQELEAEIDSVESGKPPNMDIIARFSEIVQMLVTYNKEVQATAPGTQLFCPTSGGSMELNEIVSMVRAAARSEAVKPDSLVQGLMLASFRERFPCR